MKQDFYKGIKRGEGELHEYVYILFYISDSLVRDKVVVVIIDKV